MKIFKYGILLMSLTIIIVCCKQQIENYQLTADVVEIRFTKQVQDGDWFKLDDLLFTHVMNDTTDLMNQPQLSHYDYFGNASAEFVDKGLLPAGILHYHAQGDVHQETVPTARMAAMFVRRLYQKQIDGTAAETIYQIGDAEFLLLNGRVFIKRNDDEKIIVTSNAPDRILISPLLKTDKTYISLFGKAEVN